MDSEGNHGISLVLELFRFPFFWYITEELVWVFGIIFGLLVIVLLTSKFLIYWLPFYQCEYLSYAISDFNDFIFVLLKITTIVISLA